MTSTLKLPSTAEAVLLRAIAAGGDLSSKALADATGKAPNNIARDLDGLVKAGWIAREPGSPPSLTADGVAVLAALDRFEGKAEAGAEFPLDLIDADPLVQPRTVFEEAELEALAASIREKNVFQPVLLRQGEDQAQERRRIVTGERRVRASRLAGKTTIPFVFRHLTDAQAREIALIENIQREDLNPIEEANGFKAVIDARMADPVAPVSLREAKEAIATATGKTVRYVELRLQLLGLDAADQARMALPKEDKAHLSIKDARDQLQKPKAPPVDPAELLALAEIATAAGDLGKAEVRAADLDDDALWKALRIGYKVNGPYKKRGEDGFWNGRQAVETGWSGDQLLREHCPAFYEDEGAEARAAFIAGLRIEVLGEKRAAAWLQPYVTPWLNPPDAIDQDTLAAVDLFKAEEIAEARARETARTARQAEQAAREQTARHAAADLDAVNAGLRLTPPEVLDRRVPQTVERMELTAPFRAEHGVVRDVDGKPICMISSGIGLENNGLAAELLALALNAACGMATPEPPPPEVDDDAFAETAERFEDWIAARLIDMHSLDVSRAAEAAKAALARVLDTECTTFGDPSFDWSATAAEEIADGYAEDGYPETETDTPAYLARLAGAAPVGAPAE